uniref:Replication protein A 70 kDa DNA-binding subunit B n=1 Tax=Tanacetum cinerariifolium TaxID=118510 RepID=A0A6L2JKY6_TANCI|nr:replication protein A 70 kDa DNA-binding subunit B [Tanacetum cinerariifolium]
MPSILLFISLPEMVNAEGIMDVLMDRLNALDLNNRKFTKSELRLNVDNYVIVDQYGAATVNVHSIAMSSRLDAVRSYNTITQLHQEEDGQFDVIGHVVACEDLDNYDKNAKAGKQKPLWLVVHRLQSLQEEGSSDMVDLEAKMPKKKSDGKDDWFCTKCNVVSNIKMMFRLQIRVQDKSETMSLTLLNDEVQPIVDRSAYQLCETYGKSKNTDMFPMEITDLIGKKYAFKVLIDAYNVNKLLLVFTVLRLSDDPEIIESIRPMALQQRINKLTSFVHDSVESQTDENTTTVNTGKIIDVRPGDKRAAKEDIASESSYCKKRAVEPRWENDPGKLGASPDSVRRRSKQPFILEESPIDTIADQRTMAELLRAPTEGYAEAIVVPPILADQFELKHSLINMMTTDQFFGLEKDNPHDHIRAARRWLEKEPSRSIHTWEDLDPNSSMNYFPPQKQQISVMKSPIFNNALMNHTFYNALNPADEDSLNAAAGGNLLERRTQDVLMIIKNKSKVHNSRNKSVVSQVKACDANSNSSEIAKLTHAVNQQTSAVTTAMTAILKQFQATPPPAFVKAVEEICVTCGGAHPYYQCLAAGGNTFPELRHNIQGYVSAAIVNYNQGNSFYHPPGSGSLPSNTVANPKGELKAITTRSGLVLDGPTVPTPPPFINPEKDEHVEETLTDPNLSEYTIKVPPPPVQKYKPPSQREYVVHQRDPVHPNIPYPSTMLKQKKQEKDEYQKILKALLSNKEKLQELANTPLNENCSAVILKKLPEKLRDPGKFLILCGFSELKCKVLADLADFVIVDYESDPRIPLILGRPFLGTAHALIDVHEVESDTENVYDDSFDSKGEKIKESKLLIDELDLPCDFLPSEYGSFISQDFSRIDALPSTNNEGKIFNPCILSKENPFEIITRVVQDKKLAISNASLVLEDFAPPFYEPLFFKEVPRSNMLLPFSSENEEKVFKPGIYTSEKFILLLSQNYLIKVIKFSKSTKFLKAR